MTCFRIAVLISGGGTTLKNLIEKIEAGRLRVQIALVISSSPTPGDCNSPAMPAFPRPSSSAKCFASQEEFSRGGFRPLPRGPGRPGRHGRIPQAGDDRRRTLPIA